MRVDHISLLHAAIKHSPRSSPGEVLELAYGTGLTTIPLSKAGITMTGVDISSEMLKYARLKAEGADCYFYGGRCSYLRIGQAILTRWNLCI
ncbi:class I SAM-dependent methyltransferase [Paenibacillus sp. 1001270B_150601_E10]|uniref:methyltransferase domain-containing protein n=1 Tax=Paenibacillus sp. 1001270B_150601_E10 TaxID=2787079 RepID=UPI001E429E71|nr:class I SAM-dependent methyltransferase [Paenibacillus sp. 1001270B_150601_E10]